jgi:hypothetical protein
LASAGSDPFNKRRIIQQRPHRADKISAIAPGLIAIALAVVALGVGLFAFAQAHTAMGEVAMTAAEVIGGVGLAWLVHIRRRSRGAQSRMNAIYRHR